MTKSPAMLRAGKFAVFALFILVWEFGVRLFEVPQFILPGPVAIFAKVVSDLTSGLIMSDLGVTLWEVVAGFALGALFGLAIGEGPRVHLSAISARSWLAWTYLVLAGSLVAFPVYVWLLKHSTPARVSTYAYVNPVTAVTLGALFRDEVITRN